MPILWGSFKFFYDHEELLIIFQIVSFYVSFIEDVLLNEAFTLVKQEDAVKNEK